MTVMIIVNGGDNTGYRAVVDKILAYEEENDLILNIEKTRGPITDCSKKTP